MHVSSLVLMIISQLVPTHAIYDANGADMACALPGVNSFTGSDTTRKLAGKGKQIC